MKKNYQSILLLVILFYFFVFCLLHSELIVKEIISYTTLFFHQIFPTSFIFLLLSYLLIENNLFYYIQKIINNKGLYFFLVSIISGYPAGTIYVKKSLIKGEISKQEANQYILFSHFPNPLFVLYHMKNLFPKTIIPFCFYGGIFLSNMILFLRTKPKINKELLTKNKSSFTKSFQTSLTQTFSTLIVIYGTSIFFYLLSQIITHYFSLSSTFYVFLCGTFDLTKGILLTNMISNQKIQGILLYYFIVFGSIPIHLQIKSILSDTSISYKSFLKGRIISFLICTILWLPW